MQVDGAEITPRYAIPNANKSLVPTTPFLDQRYGAVSAIFACSVDHFNDPCLPACVVHNPLANVPLPEAVFGSALEEWKAYPLNEGGEYELRKVQRGSSVAA
jgi:hypothetical protein